MRLNNELGGEDMGESTTFLDELRLRAAAPSEIPPPVALWLQRADEEIAVITRLLALNLSENQQLTTEETPARVAVPLGHGRSFREMIEELQRFEIIQRSSEEAATGTYSGEDARRNPSWELGRMFFWLRRVMREVGLLEKDSLPDWYPRS